MIDKARFAMAAAVYMETMGNDCSFHVPAFTAAIEAWEKWDAAPDDMVERVATELALQHGFNLAELTSIYPDGGPLPSPEEYREKARAVLAALNIDENEKAG